MFAPGSFNPDRQTVVWRDVATSTKPEKDVDYLFSLTIG